jgi:hypothetical protein
MLDQPLQKQKKKQLKMLAVPGILLLQTGR